MSSPSFKVRCDNPCRSFQGSWAVSWLLPSLLFLSLSPSSPSLLLPLRPATMRLLGFVLVDAMLAAELAVSNVRLHPGFVQYFWPRLSSAECHYSVLGSVESRGVSQPYGGLWCNAIRVMLICGSMFIFIYLLTVALLVVRKRIGLILVRY